MISRRNLVYRKTTERCVVQEVHMNCSKLTIGGRKMRSTPTKQHSGDSFRFNDYQSSLSTVEFTQPKVAKKSTFGCIDTNSSMIL